MAFLASESISKLTWLDGSNSPDCVWNLINGICLSGSSYLIPWTIYLFDIYANIKTIFQINLSYKFLIWLLCRNYPLWKWDIVMHAVVNIGTHENSSNYFVVFNVSIDVFSCGIAQRKYKAKNSKRCDEFHVDAF